METIINIITLIITFFRFDDYPCPVDEIAKKLIA